MNQHEPSAADRAGQMLQAHQETANRNRFVATVVVLVLVIAAVAVGGYLAATGGGDDDGDADVAVPANSTGDTFGFELTPALATGTDLPKPAVTLGMYEDFLCPSCGEFERQSGAFVREQVAAGRISVVYHPFTFLVNASTNRYSQRASNAAACVADTAGVPQYAVFHELLYANQPAEGGPGHEDDVLIAWAEQAGAPDAAECIREETFEAWVAEATEYGLSKGINTTPTLTLNDSIVKEADGSVRVLGPDRLDEAIRSAGG